MTLEAINKQWNTYKDRYGLDSPVEIQELRFDAAKGVDSSFDMTELYADTYILHLNPKIHLYRSDYVDLVLWHEFTHLYDFLLQPFSYKVMRKVYLYMNTYSEYHAARRTLARVLDRDRSAGNDPDKCVIPTAYKEISLRELVSDTLRHAEGARAWFSEHPGHQSFHIYLRYVMYLMGYASHFANKEDILKFCLSDLQDSEELYMELFRILEEKDFFKIIEHMDVIYKEAGI